MKYFFVKYDMFFFLWNSVKMLTAADTIVLVPATDIAYKFG